MTFNIKKNTIIPLNELHKYNPIIIYSIGGSYSSFLLRIMHKHLSDLPIITDDFIYQNGNSHSVHKFLHFDDFKIHEYKKNLVCWNDISAKYIIIRRDCFPKLSFKKLKIIENARLNIKIKFNNKSDVIWVYIQNIIKNSNLKDFLEYDFIDPNWFLKNDLSKKKEIIRIFKKMINAANKSWYELTNEENTINLCMNEILDAEKLYVFLTDVAKNLNIKINSFNDFKKDHDKFLNAQQTINSYYRHQNKNYDENNLVDICLKEFSY